MFKFIEKNIYNLIPLTFILAVLFVFISVSNLYQPVNRLDQQFSELARAFLHYKLYFLDSSIYNNYIFDNVLFNGHYYWPLGPLPAVILMPFVWLGSIWQVYFYQSYLNFFLVLLIAYLIFKLARRLNFLATDSAYWSVAFVFSSMFLGVAIVSSSWYFAQTVTVLLLFLALLEYFGQRRYFLIGIILGLVLLTRATAFIGILFFLLDILWSDVPNWRIKFKNIGQLAVGSLLGLIILFSYNYARFQDPLDQGYRAQILSAEFMADKDNYGLFNFKYLPRGIYYSLLSLPQPVFNSSTHLIDFPFLKSDRWGMSIFLTSPYLLYLFFMKIKKKKAVMLLITSIIIWLIISASFFIGYTQFGFRYALDFWPLLFTAFMITYQDNREKMGRMLKIIIIVSAIFNLYLLFNI